MKDRHWYTELRSGPGGSTDVLVRDPFEDSLQHVATFAALTDHCVCDDGGSPDLATEIFSGMGSD